MTHWRKTLALVSRFASVETRGLSKALAFYAADALCCRKISTFRFFRDLCVIESSASKWASPFSSKRACSSHASTRSSAKTSSFARSRGFSNEATAQSPRAVEEDQEAILELLQGARRSSRSVVEAQEALLDYLHCTRGLNFPDAEHMSKHSPVFLQKLLEKVEKEEEIGKALTRFFRYHPINEFEPFFESIGLKPGEFNSFLPRDLMFLSDDEQLLENFRVLCNYGIARSKIGKIYRDATEIFKYKSGVLLLKLQAYEGLGLSKSSVIKVAAATPVVLIGEVNGELVKVLEGLDDFGIQRDWIGSVLSDKKFYDWRRMNALLQFFIELGFSKEEMGDLIKWHPDFLLDGSGKMVFSVVALLSKLGGGKKDLFDLFSNFPNITIGNFTKNFRKGLLFLIEIEMSPEDIEKLLVSHPEIFGSCSLKKPNSIFTYLNVGKKRLCRIIQEDPHQLKKYTLGTKLYRLPNSGADERSLREKKKFLIKIGFAEESEDMKKALKVFRGKGDELQHRYNFLVEAGLDPNDVVNMIKLAPQVLNQKIDVLERKISFLVNNLEYPLSSLVAFPSYMSYTVERVKLRFLMYNWLKDRGKASPCLALSSVLACSDKVFMKKFVNHHPEGPEVWENFKKALSLG